MQSLMYKRALSKTSMLTRMQVNGLRTIANQQHGIVAPQFRFFSNENKKNEPEEKAQEGDKEEATEEVKDEKTPEVESKQEKASSGGSGMAMGLLAVLGLGGVGLLMSKGDEKSTPQEKVSASPAAASAAPAKQAEKAVISVAVEGQDDMIDVQVTGASELQEGSMMEVKVGAGKKDNVLVTRYKGSLHAIGAYCSHFGAPLVNGVLFDDKVLCPLHAAGFSVTSGALELAPGLDGVPKYTVHEKDGKTYVRVPKTLQQKQSAPMAKRDPNNKTKMVIVGGGAAGLNCAESLRQSNFTGEITIVSDEKRAPYDRTLLSKVLATGNVDKLGLRDSGFYDEADIDCQLGYKVSAINRSDKSISLSNGDSITYDKLLLATGSRARRVRNEGADLPGVYYLRDGDDQLEIKEAAKKAQNIVVIGGGFIGAEATANLAKTYPGKVSLVLDTQNPLELYFGYDISAMFLNEHQKNGVKIYNNRNLMKNVLKAGPDGRIKELVLDNGYTLPADIIVIGAGAEINTQLAKDAGLDMDPVNRGVSVNPFLQTSDSDIFAAGDIASFPAWSTGGNTRIEHWIVASDQGAYSAFNMLGKMIPYGNIPFFWTNQFGKGFQYVGQAFKWDYIHMDGEPRTNKFMALFIKDNKVLAACGQGRGGDILTIFEAMQQNVLPPADEIVSGVETTASIKNKLKLNKGGACRRENCCQKKSIVQ